MHLRLRLRLEFPREAAVGEKFADAQREVDPDAAILATGLQQQHAMAAVLRQSGRKRATGRSGAHNNVVKSNVAHVPCFAATARCWNESRRKLNSASGSIMTSTIAGRPHERAARIVSSTSSGFSMRKPAAPNSSATLS